MKRPIHLLAFIAVFTLLFTACKKDKVSDADDKETELTVQSDDQAKVSSDFDAVDDEINGALESSPALTGKDASTQALCNATVVIDSLSNPRSVTITYNGLNCNGTATRTGTVKATIPSNVKWKDAGATLTVTITNLKITRVSDGKFITINGTKQITNVSGGRLISLQPGAAIIHTINSNNMTVKFDTSALQRSWSIAKKRVFTMEAGGLVIKTSGNETVANTTKVMEWGTNRFGSPFITSTEEDITVRASCNFRVTSGRVKHDLVGRNLTVTFGLDAQGNATTCPGANPYYMKLVWTGPGSVSHTLIRPY